MCFIDRIFHEQRTLSHKTQLLFCWGFFFIGFMVFSITLE